jgi:hypothetical protein
MTRQHRVLWLLVIMSVLPIALTTAQEILTNDSIITMKKAGLSDGVILASIRSSSTKFDVSTAALVKLKQAGVPDAIIEAMVARSGPPTVSPGSPPPPTTTIPGLGEPRAGNVYHISGDKYVELEPALSSIETNFQFFSSKSEMVLKGRKAHYRISEPTPTFVMSVAPTEMPLVRLKPGDDHDDRNLKVSTGGFAPFSASQSFGIRTEDMVDVSSEKDPRGFYRIRPRQPLPRGEYGFVHVVGMAARAAGRVFDFGVD